MFGEHARELISPETGIYNIYIQVYIYLIKYVIINMI